MLRATCRCTVSHHLKPQLDVNDDVMAHFILGACIATSRLANPQLKYCRLRKAAYATQFHVSVIPHGAMPTASSFAAVSKDGQLSWQLKQSRFAVLSVPDVFAGRSHMLLAACQAQVEDWIRGETVPSSEMFTRGPNKWRIDHRLHHKHDEHIRVLRDCTDEVCPQTFS